jgi:phenylalanyl-tRNA synthetase beta chain
MKISYNWLSTYVDGLPEPERLSELLTSCGLEVEAMEQFQSVPGGLKGMVIAKVEQCEKHPNADKLSICKVNTGSGDLLPVVCGAPNVAAGQKVLFATVGTFISSPKGEFVIQKAKIRGEVSEGMICAEDEAGLGTSHAGIMVLPDDAVPGTPAAEYFKIEEDVVFEIGLTPNRCDATSHLGVARDVIAVLNVLSMKEGKNYQINVPSVEAFKQDNDLRRISVTVEDPEACPRYSGLSITGIKVAESPAWLQNRLKAIGLRPINNIVDITNYILFETGQPLHAFDASKIAGDKVIVKKLAAGTAFITLDSVERKLDAQDLMICNAKEGMCMAGVFGGLGSGVTNETTEVFLESACFDPATIRKTSKRHTLKTDASFRFERGTDINMTIYALKRAAMLICELAGGKISSGIEDVCNGDTAKKKISFSLKELDKIAGKMIPRDIVENIFESLDITVLSKKGDDLEIDIPTAKNDVTRQIDVIEEVMRIYGYQNIEFPESLRTNLSFRNKPDNEVIRNAVAACLSERGFHEILTNSLTTSAYSEKFSKEIHPDHNVPILNPLSKELNVLRQSLLFTGLEVVAYNRNRKNSDLSLYEFGTVYSMDKAKTSGLEPYCERPLLALYMTGNRRGEHWSGPVIKISYYDLKAAVENLFYRLGIDIRSLKFQSAESEILEDNHQYLSGTDVLCSLGRVAQKVTAEFDIKDDVYYACFDWNLLVRLHASLSLSVADIPKFPEVRRDLALLINPGVSWQQIEEIAYKTDRKYLRSLNLFDVYTDEKMKGKKSYAVSFTLRDDEKTLTDNEIDKVMKKLVEAYSKELGAELR